MDAPERMTKHEHEDWLNSQAPDCPPDGEEVERLRARIKKLEKKADHAWDMVARCDADVIAATARAEELGLQLLAAKGQAADNLERAERAEAQAALVKRQLIALQAERDQLESEAAAACKMVAGVGELRARAVEAEARADAAEAKLREAVEVIGALLAEYEPMLNGQVFIEGGKRDATTYNQARATLARLTGETQDGGAMSDRIEALEAERDTLVYDLARLKDSETHHLNRADAAEATITELRKEVERLQGLISDIIEAYDWWQIDSYERDQGVTADAIDAARAALQGETK